MYEKIEVLSINADWLKDFVDIMQKGILEEEKSGKLINSELSNRLKVWIESRSK
jgi:hypothetical protein